MEDKNENRNIYEEGISLLIHIKNRYSNTGSYQKLTMHMKNVLNELHALRIQEIIGDIKEQENETD